MRDFWGIAVISTIREVHLIEINFEFFPTPPKIFVI